MPNITLFFFQGDLSVIVLRQGKAWGLHSPCDTISKHLAHQQKSDGEQNGISTNISVHQIYTCSVLASPLWPVYCIIY